MKIDIKQICAWNVYQFGISDTMGSREVCRVRRSGSGSNLNFLSPGNPAHIILEHNMEKVIAVRASTAVVCFLFSAQHFHLSFFLSRDMKREKAKSSSREKK